MSAQRSLSKSSTSSPWTPLQAILVTMFQRQLRLGLWPSDGALINFETRRMATDYKVLSRARFPECQAWTPCVCKTSIWVAQHVRLLRCLALPLSPRSRQQISPELTRWCKPCSSCNRQNHRTTIFPTEKDRSRHRAGSRQLLAKHERGS